MSDPIPCSLNDLCSGGITFIMPGVLAGPDQKPSDKYIRLFLKQYRGRAISDLTIVTTQEICDVLSAEGVDETFVLAPQPKVRFARLINERRPIQPLIHDSVTILDPDTVEIGRDVTIYPNVVIYGDTVIGDNVTIHANSVIGFPGFGPVWDEAEQEWVMFPQVARVVIGDRVEIGACTTIQRGALEDTVIETGCRISDHVRIGHGVKIGADSVITCCTEISGSVHIGRHVWIGPQTSIREALRIGDNAVVGIGSNLTKDVDPGITVVGNPARPLAR
jgi:UDP-3-O-[3-hydroxymyristoyl] glucosamine N-acyltransferase